jgi:hypothetical protein
MLLSVNPRLFDRCGMKIVPNKSRFRIGLRHHDGRKPVAATNVGRFAPLSSLAATPSSAGSQELTRLL